MVTNDLLSDYKSTVDDFFFPDEPIKEFQPLSWIKGAGKVYRAKEAVQIRTSPVLPNLLVGLQNIFNEPIEG